MKDQGFLKKCCHGLAKEFRIENFKLNHVPVDDFYTSQWLKDSRSVIFLIYRWVVALFFLSAVFTCMGYLWSEGKFFIHLTNWGFMMCMVTTVYGAVIVTRNYLKPFDSVKQSLIFKAFWALHSITLVTAVIITVVYWSFLWEGDEYAKKSSRRLTLNAFQHACNTGVMFFDTFIVAFPTRLLHFIYPLAFGVIYTLFSFIYYAFGGTDSDGNRYIYYFLNWSQPGYTFVTLLGITIMICTVTVINFGVYKLRRLIYELIHFRDIDLPH